MNKDKKVPVILVNAEYHDTMLALLNVAACPACDGGGILRDSFGEPMQCQWCDEKERVINAAYDKTP